MRKVLKIVYGKCVKYLKPFIGKCVKYEICELFM